MRLRAHVMAIGFLAALAMPRGWQGAWAADKDAPWHLQRLQVPADRPDDWPRDKTQRYLPMPAEEFEQRLAQLRPAPRQATPIESARLVSADYTATLVENNLVDGEAQWQFESHGKEKAVVVLGECQLALANPRWADLSQPALLGNDQYGRLAVEVQRSGQLRCGWSLRGRRDSAENLIFELQLPESPINTLHLTLPAELVAQVDRGLASPEGEPHRGQQRWTIELGGNHRAKLQIAKRNAVGGDRPLTLIQTSQTFDVSQRGLELTAEFRLQAIGGPLRRLSLTFDQPLSPVRAEIGGVELPIVLASNEGTAASHTEIEFPEPLEGSGHRLRVTAVAPLASGQRWRLPMIHAVEAHWLEGEATLRVAAPLVLDELACTGCRQMKAEPLGKEPTGEVIGIQCFGDSPEIGVNVSERREQIRVASGVSISLRAAECAGRYLADFTAAEGERFALEAEVAPQWIIDNVESDIPGRIVDWSHEALPGKPGKLKLQLRTPLSPQHALRLVVTGRRRRAPIADRMRTADLEMLTFADAEATRRLICLQTVDPYQLQFSGSDAAHYLPRSQLASGDAALLDETSAGVVFVDDEQARGLSVSLSVRPPRYQAEIHAEAQVHDTLLTESYRFSIVPQGREMARIVVRFSQPRAEPIAWSMVGESESTPLRSHRLPETEQNAQGLSEGETWEVLLPTPQSTPFTIQAVREFPLHGETPVALAALIGAETQRGTVTVRSTGATLPELRSRRLPALPLEAPPAGQQSTLLAAFRYEPEEDTLQVAEPPLVLASRDAPGTNDPAWIWQAQLDSQYQRGGAEHVLTCRVENTGRADVEFRLPDGARLRGTWVDGQRGQNSPADDSPRCRVALPAGVRFVSVVVHWTENSGVCRGAITSTRAPWPDCDVPILARQWNVSLPAGFEVVDARMGGTPVNTAPWIARLFGPLARREARADDAAVNQTAHKPAGLISPWKPSIASVSQETAGWNTYQFDDSNETPGKIWVADQHAVAAWSWASFVIVAACGWWLGRRQLLPTLAIFGVATAAALLAPPAWVMISAAAWMGLIVGQFLSRIWRPAQAAELVKADRSESASGTKKLIPAGTAICLFAILTIRGAVQAEDEVRSSALTRATNIRQVLIPVDKDQHPTGGLDYLPESFYDELVRATADAKFASPQYLITQATYQAQLGRDAAGGDLTSGDWQAALGVESLADHAVLQFPFDSKGAALVPDGIKVDGQTGVFHWNEKEQMLSIELGARGRHRLEVLLRPQRHRGGFDFLIPAAATAQLDLPKSSAGALEVETALGAASGSLGPATKIVVRPLELASAAESARAPAFDVDELYWMHVRPGSVTIDGRYRLKVREGQLQQLQLLMDSRLLPLEVTGGGAMNIRRVSDKLNAATIALRSPVTGEATIDVSFLVDGAGGVGDVRLPRLQVAGAAAARRWWAATLDPALETNETAPANQSLTPAQFAELWGSDELKPQLAFDGSIDDAELNLSTRLRETKLAARLRMALNVDETSIGVRLAANMTPQGGPAFEYRLAIPAALEIHDVTASDAHGERAIYWARTGENLLTVMLAAPANGEIKLLARGRLPRSSAAKFSLPEIRLQGSESDKFRSIVFRTSEVRVEVSEAGGFKTLPNGEAAAALAEAQHDGLIEPLRAGEEQLVAVLDGPLESHPAVLRIEPNRPKVRAAQATSLSRGAEAWQAGVDLSLQVDDGVLDVLRFELPPEWRGPFKITPAMTSVVTELPGLNRRQLVVFPETPLSGAAHLHIAGPLTVAGGERPAAPDVFLVGAPRLARFFLLPRRMEDQQLSWDTRGLILGPLPEELAAIVTDAGAYRSYQLLRGGYRAMLRSAERTVEDPQVRLADISTCCEVDGSCWGVAAYDLEPAGATSCQLELPDGLQVVHALLDGIAAQRVGQGENRWNIWLGDNKLPRRLEVVFAGRLNQSAGSIQFLPAPQLVDIPVERTLWSVSAPRSFAVGVPPKEASISEMRHELIRYESTTTLTDSAAGLLLEESPDNLLRWYAPWGQRFLNSRAALGRQLAAGAEDNTVLNAAEEIATIEQDHARLARRLGTSNLMSQLASEPAIAADPIRLWSVAQLPGRTLSFALARGDSEPLAVDYPQRRSDDRWARILTAGAILLAVLSIALARWRGWIHFDLKWEQIPYGPHALGIIAAIVWWMWLSPRFIAAVILAACIVAIVRHVWRVRPSAVQPVFAVTPRTASNPGSSRTRF